MKWKKLLQDSDTISYVKDSGEYKVIIEARQYEDGWEIVKKYLGSGVNFAETYSAQSSHELKRILKRLRSERDLSRADIKDIAAFKKKQLRVLVKRGWKEQNVEKWFFSIGEDYSNHIVIRYGRDIDVDIVMEEQLKYIEDRLLVKLFDVLGLGDLEEGVNQTVYYFSKKTSAYVEPEDAQIDFEFLFE